MATTTPNFGWSVPTSTDLVKDGATAIETLGDAIDASLVDLKGGTTGQVLKKNSGTDMDFVWGTAPSGKLLQVVSASTTTSVSISVTSMTDTGITATITPTSATSKILVIFSSAVRAFRSANNANTGAQLLRGATKIIDMNTEAFIGGQFTGVTTVDIIGQYTNHYLDSPATTSATTYKLQANFNTTAGSPFINFQYNNAQSTITLMEIGA